MKNNKNPLFKKVCGNCKYWDEGVCLLFESSDPFGDWYKEEQKSKKRANKIANIETTILTGENSDDINEKELDEKKDVRIYPSLRTTEKFGCTLFKEDLDKIS